MVSRIYKRMAKFISFIKESIMFFLAEIDKRLAELNDKINEKIEYTEVLKDCVQLNCMECKFNKMCDFSNSKKGR
jgi:hypothetical protein